MDRHARRQERQSEADQEPVVMNATQRCHDNVIYRRLWRFQANSPSMAPGESAPFRPFRPSMGLACA
jgi:hypothetical protein